ncbi:MAG: ribonuclease P protein component [Rhodocyclaceae bacterium]|nr:ribonuclease P protein component [Rhodocyclaceae bacterium]
MAEAFGFGAELRLRQAGDFGAVFAHRRVLRGRLFDLHYRPNGGASARLGLVIAKRLARRAVWRNAIKRTGREAFRCARPGLPAMDLLLRLAKPVAALEAGSRQAWRADIDALLAKLPR